MHRYLYGSTTRSERLKKFVDPRKVKPLRPILNEMRVFKSEDEVVHMRRLGQASGRAFTETMRQTFSREKDLCSFLEYQFRANGCDTSAFVPVVAGGENALSIHYTRNDDVLRYLIFGWLIWRLMADHKYKRWTNGACRWWWCRSSFLPTSVFDD